MDRLNQHNFKDFLSTAKETEPEELARMMWPDHDTDLKHFMRIKLSM